MKTFGSSSFRRVSLAFLLAIIFASLLATVPVVHATSVLWCATGNTSSSSLNCSVNTNAGDFIVVADDVLLGTGAACSNTPYSWTVTDGEGDSFSSIFDSGCQSLQDGATRGWAVMVWQATSINGNQNPTIVTVTANCGPCNIIRTYMLEVFDVHNGIPTVQSMANQKATYGGGCACQTNIGTSLSIPASGFEMEYTTDVDVSSGSCAAGVGFTLTLCGNGQYGGSGEFALDTSVTSPSNFPLNQGTGIGGSAQYEAVGLVFGLVVPITTTFIVPPSVFSINYWIGPLLFLGLYDGLFFGHAAVMKVSTKGLIYMLLSGFVMGSLIGFIMGFIGIQLIIMCILVMIIWWYRFR